MAIQLNENEQDNKVQLENGVLVDLNDEIGRSDAVKHINKQAGKIQKLRAYIARASEAACKTPTIPEETLQLLKNITTGTQSKKVTKTIHEHEVDATSEEEAMALMKTGPFPQAAGTKSKQEVVVEETPLNKEDANRGLKQCISNQKNTLKKLKIELCEFLLDRLASKNPEPLANIVKAGSYANGVGTATEIVLALVKHDDYYKPGVATSVSVHIPALAKLAINQGDTETLNTLLLKLSLSSDEIKNTFDTLFQALGIPQQEEKRDADEPPTAVVDDNPFSGRHEHTQTIPNQQEITDILLTHRFERVLLPAILKANSKLSPAAQKPRVDLSHQERGEKPLLAQPWPQPTMDFVRHELEFHQLNITSQPQHILKILARIAKGKITEIAEVWSQICRGLSADVSTLEKMDPQILCSLLANLTNVKELSQIEHNMLDVLAKTPNINKTKVLERLTRDDHPQALALLLPPQPQSNDPEECQKYIKVLQNLLIVARQSQSIEVIKMLFKNLDLVLNPQEKKALYQTFLKEVCNLYHKNKNSDSSKHGIIVAFIVNHAREKGQPVDLNMEYDAGLVKGPFLLSDAISEFSRGTDTLKAALQYEGIHNVLNKQAILHEAVTFYNENAVTLLLPVPNIDLNLKKDGHTPLEATILQIGDDELHETKRTATHNSALALARKGAQIPTRKQVKKWMTDDENPFTERQKRLLFDVAHEHFKEDHDTQIQAARAVMNVTQIHEELGTVCEAICGLAKKQKALDILLRHVPGYNTAASANLPNDGSAKDENKEAEEKSPAPQQPSKKASALDYCAAIRAFAYMYGDTHTKLVTALENLEKRILPAPPKPSASPYFLPWNKQESTPTSESGGSSSLWFGRNMNRNRNRNGNPNARSINGAENVREPVVSSQHPAQT